MEISRSEKLKGLKISHEGNLTNDLTASVSNRLEQLQTSNIQITTPSAPNGPKK